MRKLVCLPQLRCKLCLKRLELLNVKCELLAFLRCLCMAQPCHAHPEYVLLPPCQCWIGSQRLQRMLCLPHKALPLHSTKQRSQIRAPEFDLPADAFQ